MNMHSQRVYRLILTLLGFLIILACVNPLGNVPNGQVKVKGIYEFHSDVTTDNSSTGVVHTKIDMVADFTATSQADDKMVGTAQVTYVENYEIGGESCELSWTTDNIVWSPDLSGTIQKNQDGSLTIGLLANPKEGPSFSEDYLCLGEIPITPTFPGTGGVLVNGKYDQRHDFTVGPNITGTTYETVHMEIVP